ncbi:hypothetical protein GJ496_005401 [Pomphorhynchus laevis]|nr:hypothetical protein GJ496_005401 [Pomphorhynchus laevis]
MNRERMFKKMMLSGKLSSAMKFLQDDPGCGSILNPSDVTNKGTVRDILLQKHPDAGDINPDAIVTSPIAYPAPLCSNKVQSSIFQKIRQPLTRTASIEQYTSSESQDLTLISSPSNSDRQTTFQKMIDGTFYQLPLRYGGLGISLPDTRPELNLKYSIRLCSILSENIPVTQIKAKQQEKALEISKERDIDFQKQAYALKFHNEEAYHKMLQDIGSKKISMIRKTLERMLRMWHHNEHHNLFPEAAIIQNRMEVQSRNHTNNHAEKRWYKDFIKLITHGKTTSAVRMLSLDGIRNGVHQMDDKLENHMTVRYKLSILHPEAGELNQSFVLSMSLEGVCDHYSEVFQCIDSQII